MGWLQKGHWVPELAMRALQNLKVAIESDSVRAHKRAVGKLCRLKLRLEASDELSKDVAQVLVSAGAMVGRAVTFAKNEDDAADLGITMSLLFGLVVICKTCPPARDEEELDGLKATLAAYDAFTIDGERENYIPHHVAAGALLRLWSTPDGVAPTAIVAPFAALTSTSTSRPSAMPASCSHAARTTPAADTPIIIAQTTTPTGSRRARPAG